MAMDELQLQLDRDAGPRYAIELDHAAAILQRVHPIGAVKAIGRLEVTAALGDLFPADDAEPVTKPWLESVGFWDFAPPNDLMVFRPETGGVRRWDIDCHLFKTPRLLLCGSIVVLNPTRGHIRRLCAALGIVLKESP